MSLLARFEAAGDAAERRGSDRRELRLALTASLPESPEQAVTIHDLSESGLLLETFVPLTPGQDFQLFLPLAGSVASTVVWSSGHFYGCQFREKVPRAAVSAALLKSVPKEADDAIPEPRQDLVSQLREVNTRIERIGHDLDRAIDDLSARRPGPRAKNPDAMVAAALPKSTMLPPPQAETPIDAEPERFYEPLASSESDAGQWVVVISLILAGLAGLILMAALLRFPLTP